jgi:large subunit ribosomal protein L34
MARHYRCGLSDNGAITIDRRALRYTTAVLERQLLQGETIKRTFQPKKRYRRRMHGFLRRMSAKGGQRVVQNRRRKGRQRLAA